MKKLVLAAFILFSTSSFAQYSYSMGNSIFSKAGNETSLGNPGTNPNYSDNRGIRQVGEQDENPLPLAPATLLLLGLGGATVGTAVCRNQKRRK